MRSRPQTKKAKAQGTESELNHEWTRMNVNRRQRSLAGIQRSNPSPMDFLDPNGYAGRAEIQPLCSGNGGSSQNIQAIAPLSISSACSSSQFSRLAKCNLEQGRRYGAPKTTAKRRVECIWGQSVGVGFRRRHASIYPSRPAPQCYVIRISSIVSPRPKTSDFPAENQRSIRPDRNFHRPLFDPENSSKARSPACPANSTNTLTNARSAYHQGASSRFDHCRPSRRLMSIHSPSAGRRQRKGSWF